MSATNFNEAVGLVSLLAFGDRSKMTDEQIRRAADALCGILHAAADLAGGAEVPIVPALASPWMEIEKEAQRLGGSKGYSLDGLLINIEMMPDSIREDEAPMEGMAPVPRRENLLTLAAWALTALRLEDAHPGHDIYEEP